MLAKHVRKHHPGIAVLLATGYFYKKIELPGVRLLAKPYQAHTAIEALAQAFSEHRAAPPAPGAVTR